MQQFRRARQFHRHSTAARLRTCEQSQYCRHAACLASSFMTAFVSPGPNHRRQPSKGTLSYGNRSGPLGHVVCNRRGRPSANILPDAVPTAQARRGGAVSI